MTEIILILILMQILYVVCIFILYEKQNKENMFKINQKYKKKHKKEIEMVIKFAEEDAHRRAIFTLTAIHRLDCVDSCEHFLDELERIHDNKYDQHCIYNNFALVNHVRIN